MEALVGDASIIDAYKGAVPADLILMCGVFGNITADDIANTIRHLPQLCAPAATVIWTRHRQPPDLTPHIRQTFERHGFEEVSFDGDGSSPFGVGANRLIGSPQPFQASVCLFDFIGYDVLQPTELAKQGSSLEEGLWAPRT